ncbi:hypothetical protein V9T40_009547 [Parthenolecanium corni]|uniref:Uncharacterized protein n=1 Tax=Parthenolecanium corni TaxID=536013 RepID=A0AAN9Y7L7_9HEMI
MILHSGLHTNTRLQSKSSNRKSSSRYNEPKRNLSATPTSQKLRFGDDLQREFWELERKRKEKLRMKRDDDIIIQSSRLSLAVIIVASSVMAQRNAYKIWD